MPNPHVTPSSRLFVDLFLYDLYVWVSSPYIQYPLRTYLPTYLCVYNSFLYHLLLLVSLTTVGTSFAPTYLPMYLLSVALYIFTISELLTRVRRFISSRKRYKNKNRNRDVKEDINVGWDHPYPLSLLQTQKSGNLKLKICIQVSLEATL